jgi:hypothetical protein
MPRRELEFRVRSARDPSNDPTHCVDVAQDVIEMNGLVPLSALGDHAAQPYAAGSQCALWFAPV